MGQDASGEHSRHQLSVAELERWQESGAQWRALEVSDGHAVVELCTCYGEAVEVLQGDAPALIAYVKKRGGGSSEIG